MGDHSGTAGYVELVRGNRGFRLLWLGQVVSLLGDWFSFVATATLVGQLTGSSLAVGGLFVVRMLPPFLVSPFAGVVADRFDRRNVLIVTDLARAAVVLGFLLVREPGQAWLLYALSALQLALSGFFFPARNALLPDLVSARELGTANALSAATWSVMLALGAALGGLVAGRWGTGPAFAIDAATYLLSAACLARIASPRREAVDGNRGALAALREYVDGLRHLGRHPDQLLTAFHKGAFALFMGGTLQVVTVTLSQQRFVLGEGGSSSLGLMYAVAGIGTGIGPLLARRLTGDEPGRLRLAIVAGYLATALGLALMAPLASLGMVLAGLFLRGIGGGTNWVYSSLLLMQAVPGEVRGRVFSTEFGLFTLSQAAGTALGAWVLDRPGVELEPVLWALSGTILVPATLWSLWLSRVPRPNAAD